jgi:hypothetical protein
MDRNTNVREMKHKPGEGTSFFSSPAATKGAKNSLSGTNTTSTYSCSSSVKGPFGGKNTGK